MIVVLTVELTFEWNHIQGVNTVASAGQTIPLAIGGGLLARVVYVFLFKNPQPSDEPHYYREPSHRSTRRIEQFGGSSHTASTIAAADVRDFPVDALASASESS